MELEFKNSKELFDRLTPALKTKQTELKNHGYNYIHLIDIWDYLVAEKWSGAKGLSLYEMVSDILNSDNEFIDEYVKTIVKNMVREEIR